MHGTIMQLQWVNVLSSIYHLYVIALVLDLPILLLVNKSTYQYHLHAQVPRLACFLLAPLCGYITYCN